MQCDKVDACYPGDVTQLGNPASITIRCPVIIIYEHPTSSLLYNHHL